MHVVDQPLPERQCNREDVCLQTILLSLTTAIVTQTASVLSNSQLASGWLMISTSCLSDTYTKKVSKNESLQRGSTIVMTVKLIRRGLYTEILSWCIFADKSQKPLSCFSWPSIWSTYFVVRVVSCGYLQLWEWRQSSYGCSAWSIQTWNYSALCCTKGYQAISTHAVQVVSSNTRKVSR